jgi:hypothetical protein
MGVLLSGKEKQFLEDLLAGRVEKYSYHYQRVLRKRILDKRKNLTEDVYLITKAEDKLQNLPSRKKKMMKK